jgi:cytochrome b subunit of formate dehydrogenase
MFCPKGHSLRSLVFWLLFSVFILILYNLSYSQNDNDVCLSCHDNKTLVREKKGWEGTSVYVDGKKYKASSHKDILCINCHFDADVKDFPHPDTLNPVDCTICHSEINSNFHFSTDEIYKKKRISPVLQKLNKCVFCHGKHDILPKDDENSTIYRFNVPYTCGQCHGYRDEISNKYAPKEYDSENHKTLDDYKIGVHGRALFKSGLVASAICSDCHNSHDQKILNKDRKISVQVCSKCHVGVSKDYAQSIHATAKIEQSEKAAVCSACHSNHAILKADSTTFKLAIAQQCGKCHEKLLESYWKSYHGKVNQLGYQDTAKCSDCHENHRILKASDKRSSLYGDNRLKTCQKCHPKATMSFTNYVTHAQIKDRKNFPILFYTQLLMDLLLISVFIFFGLHSVLWLQRLIHDRRLNGKSIRIKAFDPEVQFVLRFRLFNRINHMIVVISFLGLASTGMILKYSYLPWAPKMAKLLGGFTTAGFFHHFFGFVTFGYFIGHLIYVLRNFWINDRNIKHFFFGSNSLIPMPRDFIQMYKAFKWFIRIGEKPAFDRWTYWEKFDYFAVFWGVAIIGSSGLILIFPEFFTRFLPGIVINIATIIHSDEALLAAGFIFTIHFFNSHLRLDKFPFDPVIFTGRVPLEEFIKERPIEYQRLVENGELEKHLVPPLNTTDWILVNIVSYTALIIGIILLLLILSSIFT